MAPHRDLTISPDRTVRFSMQTIIAILVAAFMVGGTFATAAAKFSALSDKVDDLTRRFDSHMSLSGAVATDDAVK